ncbi:unnamed protein product [Leuciscus chuanchicus]
MQLKELSKFYSHKHTSLRQCHSDCNGDGNLPDPSLPQRPPSLELIEPKHTHLHLHTELRKPELLDAIKGNKKHRKAFSWSLSSGVVLNHFCLR